MRNNIYISSSSFKTKDLGNILRACCDEGITNLELGSDVAYAEDIPDLVSKYNCDKMQFLIHNYFPRPRLSEDFVLNLASDNKEIFDRSLEHCKKAMDISAELKAPFYSVHSGFAFHSNPCDLNCKQTQLPRIPYDTAYGIFVDAISELSDYASKRGLKLAVENNVVADFNHTQEKNEMVLLAKAEESVAFYQKISSDNLFFLVDLGHLKVTGNSSGFSTVSYLDALLPYTIAFHLSDNDSKTDQHLPFDENVWFNDLLRKESQKFFIIELHNLDLLEIERCYHSLEKILSR